MVDEPVLTKLDEAPVEDAREQMVLRCAVVDPVSHVVVTIVEHDTINEWAPGADVVGPVEDSVQVGDIYAPDTETFTRPPASETLPAATPEDSKVAALLAVLARNGTISDGDAIEVLAAAE